MKVRELIPDRVVLVEGYEGGYCNPAVCETVAVLGRSKPYEGDHDYADEWDDEEIKTVCILIRKG
jgi:hypothetical protein